LDLRAFDRVFVSCRYECLEDIDRVGLIVDCGAHVGYASAYLLTRFPGSKLIALEPNPDHFAVLQANLAPYGDRCQAVCSAVWSRPAGLVFEETASGPAHKVRRRVRPARPNEVPAMNVTDLGTLLEKGGFERISILRLNIGGAESAVFAANYESWIGKVDHLAIDLHGEECRRTFLNAISSETFVVSQGKETTYCRRPG
jgi:FkbM family methyltransferase